MSTAMEGQAKEKIIAAALEHFYYTGFSGTTIRQIATKAGVNQALISYYFGGKKGLLEALMVQFYEDFFKAIDGASEKNELLTPMDKLIQIMQTAFDYLFEQYKMTRFIYRELTLDSTLIREVMTIYLNKEKYYYANILEEIQEIEEGPAFDVEMMVLQLTNALYMPFLQPQAIREVYHIEPTGEEFKKRYFLQLKLYIQTLFSLR
ncbi:forespore capture DNA-binding protein RefZ [Bacillus horti]|uniref:AcrR family transcriptional regulator n=1 Tax=Caldalkalibacillus horti TaxID=77523 RepID=A0ABT9W0K6_9BACI|nr:forespore capture DNA-binding protein RefZ [Bacillus horti]MDQ0166793.1 AcrR family transcriptional regulator [Bacillus horti]